MIVIIIIVIIIVIVNIVIPQAETILHRFSVSHTPCIPVSMLVLDFEAGGMMNLHVEDGVSERAQH